MIKIQTFNNIGVITMNAPPVNALGLGMRSAVFDALQQIYADDSIDAVMIDSALPLFCGGADIEELKSGQLWQSPYLHALIDAIDNAP